MVGEHLPAINSSASQNHEDGQNAAKLTLVSSISQFQPSVPSLHPSPGSEQYSFHESLKYIMTEKQKPGEKQIRICTDCVLPSPISMVL